MAGKRKQSRLGAPRRYETARALRSAIERYLQSISRTIQVKDHGEPVLGDDGEVLTMVQYIRPPEVSSMCAYLGIDRRTWANYCSRPEFAEVTSQVRTLMESYLAEVSLSGTKAARGAQFNLTCNYGWAEQQRLEVSGAGVEEYLQRLSDSGQEQSF